MRLTRLLGTLVFLLLCVTAAQAQSEKKLTVTGKLNDGRHVTSIDVQSTNLKQLESLENQTVKASGILSHVDGVETGPRAVLTINSIKAIKAKPEKET